MWGGAVASVLVDRLCSLLQSKACQFSEFEDQFQELKDELRYIQSFLEDANNVQSKQQGKTLKTVMADLQELVYDAEEIIDDHEHRLHMADSRKISKLSLGSSASSLVQFDEMARSLQKITQKMAKVRERITGYLVPALGLRSHNQCNVQQPLRYPILLDEDEVVGLDCHSAKIKQWILDRNEPQTVIGIVGMGGIGKTTLAQKIYHATQAHFEIKIFVTVSQSFKFEELLKKILVKLNVEEASMRGDARDLLEKLQCVLNREYLLVLDDVWDTDEGLWWESLKSSLPKVHCSCVIVTTRNEEVATSMGAVEERIHRPSLLSDEETWSLFSKVAFQRYGGDCPNSSLEGIGRKIVSTCRRLPLAIKITGGMMVAKGDSIPKWEQTLEQLEQGSASSKKDGLLISTMELSYEDLPAHLKSCLLCFAMYPEDYVYRMLDMVYWWIGEGFVWERDGRTALEIGEEYYMELLSRCLIIGQRKDGFEKKFISCRMHDIVHEMIKKIATEGSFMNVRYCYRKMSIARHQRTPIERIPKTETFMKLRTLAEEVDDCFMYGLRKASCCRLRVLDVRSKMSRSLQRYWLEGIGTLRNLNYMRLDFGNASELPDSFGGLRNLKVLLLVSFGLKKLPPSINTLEKLIVLEVHAFDLESMPHGLGKLSNLEKLWKYRPPDGRIEERNCWGVELKKLTKLRELEIVVRGSDEMEEGALKVLAALPLLKILQVRFRNPPFTLGSVKPICFHDETVLKVGNLELHPLHGLQELHILYYPGESVPAWLNSTTFPNLRLVYFESDGILPLPLTALMTGIAQAIPNARATFGHLDRESQRHSQLTLPTLNSTTCVDHGERTLSAEQRP